MATNKLMQMIIRPTEALSFQLTKAMVASVAAAGCDFAILILLVQLLSWKPAIAAIISYLLGGAVQYVLCTIWIFPTGPSNAIVGFSAFLLLSLGGLIITWLVMVLLNGQLHFHYAFSKVVALGLAFSWNFTSRKLWLFRRQEVS